MGGSVSGAMGAGMPMSSGAMGTGSYGSQNSVAMQTQQMARNPFAGAAGSSPFQPPMPARTNPQQAGGMNPQMMQAQLGQAPTPDDLYNDFAQRTMGQPPQQSAANPMTADAAMGGKSGGFGPASPMMTTPPTARGPMPIPMPKGGIPQLQAMQGNPNFQGGLRPAPQNYRAPAAGNRQFISQGSTGPLIQGYSLR